MARDALDFAEHCIDNMNVHNNFQTLHSSNKGKNLNFLENLKMQKALAKKNFHFFEFYISPLFKPVT